MNLLNYIVVILQCSVCVCECVFVCVCACGTSICQKVGGPQTNIFVSVGVQKTGEREGGEGERQGVERGREGE